MNLKERSDKIFEEGEGFKDEDIEIILKRGENITIQFNQQTEIKAKEKKQLPLQLVNQQKSILLLNQKIKILLSPKKLIISNACFSSFLISPHKYF